MRLALLDALRKTVGVYIHSVIDSIVPRACQSLDGCGFQCVNSFNLSHPGTSSRPWSPGSPSLEWHFNDRSGRNRFGAVSHGLPRPIIYSESIFFSSVGTWFIESFNVFYPGKYPSTFWF